ncbi:hypothetical protein H5410_040175 [Solanum commersonii]|uniref:Uncharacterized protein n=1 Tax=Solanum commersonii TaxID=4109 RepID=A0A9J5XPC1_SOLCO|nr:hypothetical protein H5410_040175 [Solanum commersonii]
MGIIHSEVQQQQIHQQVGKEGPSTPNNATKDSSTIIESATLMQSNSFIAKQTVNQLNQPRVPKEQLRSSAFIIEEIGENSREVTRSLFIERMGTQYVPISKLQEVLSQSRKRVGSDPRAKKKNILVARESYPNTRSCPKEIPLDWKGRNVTKSTVNIGKNFLIQRRQDLTFIPRFGPVAFPVPPLSGSTCVDDAPPEIELEALTLPTS